MCAQYVLYAPLVGKAVAGRAWERASPDHWLLLLLVLFGVRALTYQLWSSFSNMLFATRRRRIVRDGVDFGQIDREWDWYARTRARRRCNLARSISQLNNLCVGVCFCRDNFLILQVHMAAAAFYAFPSLRHLPLWDARGLAVAALLHVAATEPLFYAAHRAFHRGHLFSCYHLQHHSAKVPQPFTGKHASRARRPQIEYRSAAGDRSKLINSVN